MKASPIDRRLGRRSFLKGGLAGLAGAALLPAGAHERPGAQPQAAARRASIVRTLGKTGISLPIVSIGANAYDPGIYRRALDEGIRHIDTSSDYANGNHERVVGEALKGRPRDSYVLATSFATDHYQDRAKRVFKAGVRVQPLIDSFHGSLKRLGVDHVDIYYLAWMCSRETTLFEPYLEAVRRFQKEGKARWIGVTTHENEPEVLKTVAESGAFDVVLTVYNFRQTHREEMRAAIAQAAKAGVGVVAMKTQAGASWDRKSAGQINMSAALKWVLLDENVTTAVPGITRLDQLETDLAVMGNLALTPEEKSDLDRMERLPYYFTSLFCQQCRQCVPQCPQRLEIPALMRGSMYAYGYGLPAKAKETLRRAGISAIPCKDCASCGVTCTEGLDIRGKALDVIRLSEVPDDFLG